MPRIVPSSDVKQLLSWKLHSYSYETLNVDFAQFYVRHIDCSTVEIGDELDQ